MIFQPYFWLLEFSSTSREVGEISTSLETKIKNNQTRQQNIEQVDTNKKEKNKAINTKSLIIEIENTLTLNF